MAELKICTRCEAQLALSNGLCVNCDLEVRGKAAKEGLSLALLDLEATHNMTVPSEPPAEPSDAAMAIVKVINLAHRGVIQSKSLLEVCVDEAAPLTTEERLAILSATDADRADAAALIAARAG